MTAESASEALVYGKPVNQLPQDLYIPPEALEIFLEAFEGPLDFLLYLIKKQNIDILDIPIVQITEQYMGYIDLMEVLNLDLAAEYLVMAAMLGEIKSRMLLPKPELDDDEAEDPRTELVRRLQQYEVFRKAAFNLDELPRQERDFEVVNTALSDVEEVQAYPDVELQELLIAFAHLLKKESRQVSHQVSAEQLSVNEKMAFVLDKIPNDQHVEFQTLIVPEEGRLGIVVTFMAILELIKKRIVKLMQTDVFAPIHIQKRVVVESATEEI